MKNKVFILVCCLGFVLTTFARTSFQSKFLNHDFIHPGMAQSSEDLDYMREMINNNIEPWKTAFENLKKSTLLDFKVEPFADVFEEPFGVVSIGGNEFRRAAEASYRNALMWYITQDKRYAQKAIEILNAWSKVLRSFDGNNAKLLIGLGGYYYLNAAEILKHTSSGWDDVDIEQFTRMIKTVFYPAIKDFFTEANGNWDASMISTMMCIGVFTDSKDIFNRAVERFYRGEGNSGVTKYFYPNGQCQETTRDWGHTQMGIEEFCKAAQTAETQGLDFYNVANERLAQAVEYAAHYLYNGKIELFGIFTDRKTRVNDVYESIYRYYKYHKQEVLPYTEKLIMERTRIGSAEAFLSSTRAYQQIEPKELTKFSGYTSFLKPSEVGALQEETMKRESFISVKPGESVQDAIDKCKNKNRWIILEEGVHSFDVPLKLYSGVHIAGRGNKTILNPSSKLKVAIVNAEDILSDVSISDLLLEGGSKLGGSLDPNQDRRQRLYMSAPERAGIVLRSVTSGGIHNLNFDNITIQNFTKSGLLIYSGKNIKVTRCDISNNGGNVVPGAGFHHNINLSNVTDSKIFYTRVDDSLYGNGINILFSKNISIVNSEIARNGASGIYCAQSDSIQILDNLLEGNDLYGVFAEKLMDDCNGLEIRQNRIQNNTFFGINTFSAIRSIIENNKCIDNGNKFSCQ